MTFPIANALAASQPALIGEWGGAQALLSLNDTGGRLQLSCSTILIPKGLHPDSRGNFKLVGQQEVFTGGATLADNPAKMTAVPISGKIDGDNLQLAIHHRGAAAETIMLKRGRRTKLIRCM